MSSLLKLPNNRWIITRARGRFGPRKHNRPNTFISKQGIFLLKDILDLGVTYIPVELRGRRARFNLELVDELEEDELVDNVFNEINVLDSWVDSDLEFSNQTSISWGKFTVRFITGGNINVKEIE